MRTVIEMAVTAGRGWGYDPFAFDRAFGGEMPNPHQHRAVVPEPYQAGEPTDVYVITGTGRWATRRLMSIGPFELPFNDGRQRPTR